MTVACIPEARLSSHSFFTLLESHPASHEFNSNINPRNAFLMSDRYLYISLGYLPQLLNALSSHPRLPSFNSPPPSVLISGNIGNR